MRWLRTMRAVALCLGICGAPARAEIVINEIMYNSPGTPDVEYVELYNAGTLPRDLDGWYLLDNDDDHDRCELEGILGAGQYLVVVGRFDLFTAVYPGVGNLNPEPCDDLLPGAGFAWGNTADTVRLFDDDDALVDEVAYAESGPWPAAADGDGPSLELHHPVLDNAEAGNWSASDGTGTPGEQNSAFVPDPAPELTRAQRLPLLPAAAAPVTVSARIVDETAVVDPVVAFDSGAGFVEQPLFDDGLHGDGAAGDGRFGATLAATPAGTLVRYYFRASDDGGQVVTLPRGAPADHFAYTAGYTRPRLRINEILASNQTGATDELGQREDWVEIHNAGETVVDLGGMFLTDDRGDTMLWEFPATVVGPGEQLLVWCDGDVGQGPLHAGFRLAREGGLIALYDSVDHGHAVIDAWTFGLQGPDIAFGLFPEGASAPEYLIPPTPAAPNAATGVFSEVVINEFLAASDGGGDRIELYNRGATPKDISDWYLSDRLEEPTRYRFPPGSVIPPGGFLVVDSTTLGFGLAADGSEVVLLTLPDGITGADYFDAGPQLRDVTQGRFPDGVGAWHFQRIPTLGQPNRCGFALRFCFPSPSIDTAGTRPLPDRGQRFRPRGRASTSPF